MNFYNMIHIIKHKNEYVMEIECDNQIIFIKLTL